MTRSAGVLIHLATFAVAMAPVASFAQAGNSERVLPPRYHGIAAEGDAPRQHGTFPVAPFRQREAALRRPPEQPARQKVSRSFPLDQLRVLKLQSLRMVEVVVIPDGEERATRRFKSDVAQSADHVWSREHIADARIAQRRDVGRQFAGWIVTDNDQFPVRPCLPAITIDREARGNEAAARQHQTADEWWLRRHRRIRRYEPPRHFEK